MLANIRQDQLGDPTPCTDWTVHQLVDHVVAGNTRMAGGATPAEHGDDEVGDLVAAHAESARAAQARFAAPDGLTRMMDMPFGSVPGAVVIGLRTTDAIVHAWDLARATDQPTDVDADVAEAMLAVSRERIQPGFRGEGRPFAAEQACDSGRPAADRLAAFLGREVG